MLEKHGNDTPQHFEIVEAVRIGTRIIGKEKPQEDENEILESKCQPVNVTPRCILCDDTGEKASD